MSVLEVVILSAKSMSLSFVVHARPLHRVDVRLLTHAGLLVRPMQDPT